MSGTRAGGLLKSTSPAKTFLQWQGGCWEPLPLFIPPAEAPVSKPLLSRLRGSIQWEGNSGSVREWKEWTLNPPSCFTRSSPSCWRPCSELQDKNRNLPFVPLTPKHLPGISEAAPSPSQLLDPGRQILWGWGFSQQRRNHPPAYTWCCWYRALPLKGRQLEERGCQDRSGLVFYSQTAPGHAQNLCGFAHGQLSANSSEEAPALCQVQQQLSQGTLVPHFCATRASIPCQQHTLVGNFSSPVLQQLLTAPNCCYSFLALTTEIC